MITNKEITAANTSATKKDYYQIWKELLDLASKISERWDPTSTNESDPGIVLLKVLTALGDKLNYNIDANILEAFMPSAAQMESMRKLCEMMGYNIKYYQSATTKVSVAYNGDWSEFITEDQQPVEQLVIPMFTSFTTLEKDINYVALETKSITKQATNIEIPCIEGQIAKCESDNNNLVTVNQLDDNNRYYLPENQIAENGIFIYNIIDGHKNSTSYWKKVDNLNTWNYGAQIFKFGFDSKENRPYIQFPADIDQIIGDGLEIYYVRTSGISGNISPRTLNTLEKPSSEGWDKTSVDKFVVSNASAATNGANIETINQAYNNYKKTIGTFDTLVTCRDYINKIYNLMVNNTPVVSNVIVSDIRDDINKAITLCSFDDFGIVYRDTSLTHFKETISHSISSPNISSKIMVAQNDINNFDLVIYPFKNVDLIDSAEKYNESFKTDVSPLTTVSIQAGLEETKNIAHNFRYPNIDNNDIVCIKNYLQLDAKITTTYKVNIIEEQAILDNIKVAIYNKFNARQLDFGEDIPFDSILDCIETADVRIKNVSLAEPTLYTKFELADGTEYDTASYLVEPQEDNSRLIVKYPGRQAYNRLVLRNILAGKVQLFNYNTIFKADIYEKPYLYTSATTGTEEAYSVVYPENTTKKIAALKPSCNLPITKGTSTEIGKNELIQFRAPNLVTKQTYPAYVNYFLKLKNSVTVAAIPATFMTLKQFMNNKTKWDNFINKLSKDTFINNAIKVSNRIVNEETFNAQKNTYGAVFKIVDNTIVYIDKYSADILDFYVFPITSKTFPYWDTYIRSLTDLLGLFRQLPYDSSLPIGYLVDVNKIKYQQCTKWHNVSDQSALEYFFVQKVFADDTTDHTKDGLGRNAVSAYIPANAEYQLKEGEYLAINYTPATKEGQTEEPEPINKLYIGGRHWDEDQQQTVDGDIIRPNFELKDSEISNKQDGKIYAKKAGYTFKAKIPQIPEELPGMFSLGIHQQIEIRDIVKVILDKPNSYIYWTLNNEDDVIQQLKDSTTAEGYASYVLQDGEYFYYTDQNKTALAYYGSGTELCFYNGATLFKIKNNRAITVDEIANKGLAIIPWQTGHFGPGLQDKKIILREYQYVTLAENDSIEEITATPELANINSTWTAISGASYLSAGVKQKLPKLEINTETTPITWQVRSKLLLDASPEKYQTLTERDKVDIEFTNKDILSITPRKNDAGEFVPISFKTNYICRSSADRFNASTIKYTSTGAINTYDFKLKLFEVAPVGSIGASGVVNTSVYQEHNFGKQWTSVSLGKLAADEYISLSANIPANNFGLLMIKYTGSEASDGAYIKYESPTGEQLIPKIFNNKVNGEDAWWTKLTTLTGQYLLKNGVNVIKLDQAGVVKLYPTKQADMVTTGQVIISDLDLVDTLEPLNQAVLNYQGPEALTYTLVQDTAHPDPTKTYIYCSKTAAEKEYIIQTNVKDFDTAYNWYEPENADIVSVDNLLLNAINNIDLEHNFYYNCPMDNSSAIDLNTKVSSYDEKETMSSPQTWYDKNNENNKFVISQIDAEYLDEGITIARTSKR